MEKDVICRTGVGEGGHAYPVLEGSLYGLLDISVEPLHASKKGQAPSFHLLQSCENPTPAQPATQTLSPAAERPVPAPCRNSIDTVEGGGWITHLRHPADPQGRSVSNHRGSKKQNRPVGSATCLIAVSLSTCFTSREGLWSG